MPITEILTRTKHGLSRSRNIERSSPKDLCNNQDVLTMDIHVFSSRMHDIYKQTRYAITMICNPSRFASYCLHKHKFELENHLKYTHLDMR